MKIGCMFYRNWTDRRHWCITHWKECEAMGDECADFTPAIKPEEVRKKETVMSEEQVPYGKSEKLGPTGDFPQGKISADDDGGLKFAICIVAGKVIVNFGKPVLWIGLDAATAREFAARLLDTANELPPNTIGGA